MNTRQKKVLYESIMRSVAKTVKHALNEDIIADELRKSVTDFNDVIIPVLKKRLQKGIVTFEFIKADGSSRIAEGTTNSEIINKCLGITLGQETPSERQQKEVAKRNLNPAIVRFFDTVNNAWRSCKAENIVRIVDEE